MKGRFEGGIYFIGESRVFNWSLFCKIFNLSFFMKRKRIYFESFDYQNSWDCERGEKRKGGKEEE